MLILDTTFPYKILHSFKADLYILVVSRTGEYGWYTPHLGGLAIHYFCRALRENLDLPAVQQWDLVSIFNRTIQTLRESPVCWEKDRQLLQVLQQAAGLDYLHNRVVFLERK